VDRIAEGCTSLAVYGGFAAGSLDERSDLAILVIGVDGCYIASCPQFKGCHFYGETVGEALENIGEVALMCFLERAAAERSETHNGFE
jgi:predicted RNase H-like HicB family nuclease